MADKSHRTATSHALYSLAEMPYRGLGTKQDIPSALRLLESAATLGLSLAQYKLY